MADFESVAGSIDDMPTTQMEYTHGPIQRTSQQWRICNHGTAAAPKHSVDFNTRGLLFWCMKCGLPLSFVQIDRYVITQQYDRDHEKALADDQRKQQMFAGPKDDHTHIERKDGVNIVSYDKDEP